MKNVAKTRDSIAFAPERFAIEGKFSGFCSTLVLRDLFND